MKEMILKEVWMVASNLRICNILALCDKDEKGTVRRFTRKDRIKENEDPWEYYWTEPEQFDKFFETEGDAVNYRNELREELKAKMPEVNRFIRHMANIEPSEDFDFKREDYLAWYANNDEDDNYEAYTDMREKYYIVRNAIRHGMLNINAESVKMDEIVGIKWNEERYKNGRKNGGTKKTATLVLKDKNEVTTRTGIEYDVIEDLFGDNRSGRIFVKTITSSDSDDD